MKESYWGYWFIILGLFVVSILLLTNDATTTSTQDYYQLKEVANSAIYDSVDYGYFQLTGELRIHKEVFVENFLRRFAETVSPTNTYDVEFYDLFESPPKVSIKISTQTSGFIVGRDSGADAQTRLDVVNSIDLIVEFDSADLETPGHPCDGYDCSANEKYCDYYTSYDET
ncbi:MAG: hypothetical protein II625_05030 [Bacilli bacterium]|nr:hypothetical protein [Bacilli bacterium]